MRRFLIVKPSSLGDVIHAFPAVTMLASAYPDSEIDWLVAPQFAPVVKYHPAVKKLILFRRKELGTLRKFPSAFFHLLSDLRKTKYDAVIDLQGLLRSSLISECARTRLVAGPARAKEPGSDWFYGKKLEWPEKTLHAVERNVAMMADFLGIPVPEKPVFEFPVDLKDSQRARALLGKSPGGAFVALAPGARWLSKQWPPEFFAEILKLLRKAYPDFFFVLLGTKDESRQGESIISRLNFPILNLIGKTSVGELIELIRKARLLVCNDSGPMHIASAAGTPVVAFFGPTDSALTGPYSEKAEILVPELECVRCFHRVCADPMCHRMIPPEKVLSAAEKLLEK